MIDVAGQLKYLLEKNQMTLKNLSYLSELSVSYLSDIQRGKTTPTLESIERIALAFGLYPLEFLGGASVSLTNDERLLLDAYRANDIVEALRLLVHKHDVDHNDTINQNGEITEIPF
jgi:transcriptional regulator with XRE-family HTH domain